MLNTAKFVVWVNVQRFVDSETATEVFGAQEYYTVVAACGISCCDFLSSWSDVELRGFFLNDLFNNMLRYTVTLHVPVCLLMAIK